jgi:hypothetical protein
MVAVSSTSEEIGWRGYALPRLAARFGLRRASLILGLIWATWHLPLFFSTSTNPYRQSFPMYALTVMAISVVFAWLYDKTNGSLLLGADIRPGPHCCGDHSDSIVDAGRGIGVFSEKGRIKSVATLSSIVGFAQSDSVATCMADFEFERRRQPGGWTRDSCSFLDSLLPFRGRRFPARFDAASSRAFPRRQLVFLFFAQDLTFRGLGLNTNGSGESSAEQTIRVQSPKTLSSEQIWYPANRASGWFMNVAGVLSSGREQETTGGNLNSIATGLINFQLSVSATTSTHRTERFVTEVAVGVGVAGEITSKTKAEVPTSRIANVSCANRVVTLVF